jgi:hypothetical protein
MAEFAAPADRPATPPTAGSVEEVEERTSHWLPLLGSTPPFTRREQRVFWLSTTARFFNEYGEPQAGGDFTRTRLKDFQ